ncbi:anthrax toxin-like adenylyl cyclase domain-containing protein [Capilliphycus salinus ALCB114379]|uniref:anthrax toxin-like adenylyl cyclase domain-containing protein n=1 Tax=Capilliphycus salinus TaxID=2768948 RepID=UPI0039A67949
MTSKWELKSHGIWQKKNQQVIQPTPTEPDPKLVEEGFPKKVSEAFQKAADQLNCVIWSRVPGKACTTLIDEGYNLKPFYVHGKSCNWGPMAGFVCQLPVLNKAGTSKMAYNLKQHINSLEWLEKIQKREKEQDKVADSLFLPLLISDKRKQELITDGFLPNHKIIDNNLICGIAQDKDKTVAVEYLMKKRTNGSNLWDIYHRNIYIKDEKKSISYLQENGNQFSIDREDANQRNVEILASYNKVIKESIIPANIEANKITQINQELHRELQRLGIIPATNKPLDNFYAVNGIQSPYLAYRDEKNLYKNAVSGDYDLFAVWPFTPNASFEMTTRISEIESEQSESDQSQNLFISVETKKNAVEITKSRNVFIEFIGTYQELDGKEDPEIGNINDLVFFTAQTLNSLVQATYKSAPDQGQFPNRAFHSDEGGRPGVNDIDYPIAFFMPKSLWKDLKGQDVKQKNILKNTAFVVESHVVFLSLIKLLRRRFYVFLHDGWVMHLMCLAAGKKQMESLVNRIDLPKEGKKYFEARNKEIDGLGDSLKDIQLLLQELLTSTSLPESATASNPTPESKAFQDAIDNFIAFATYAKFPRAADRKGLILPLEIKIPQ